MADMTHEEIEAQAKHWNRTALELRDAVTCDWREDDDGVWHTSCEQAFVTMDGGTPHEHGMKYCCYCGKQLVEAPHTESGEDV